MRQWKDNIKVDLKGKGWEYGMDSYEYISGHGPVIISSYHSNELSCFIKFWEFLD
jgi:hypothetical protein